MARIPVNSYTTKNLIENAPEIEQPFKRGYLGFSGIGGPCTRAIWFGFRFASVKRISPRLARIFERGDIEEKRVIRDLKKIGIEVFRREGDKKIELTGEVGEKQERVEGSFGHAAGHPDGRMLGVIEAPKTEHLLEIKTMKNSDFNNFSKKGVKLSHPKYYGQVQRLMKGMKLLRTMLIATNKDNEAREYERVRYDKDHADYLEEREKEIIMSDAPIGEKFPRSHFNCKYCDQHNVCHNGAAPIVSCRSCEYVDLALGGKWICSKKDDLELSLKDQLAACKSYRRLF